MTGRDTCTGTCETAAGCSCYATCCTGRCNQGRDCRWPATIPTNYGDERQLPMPRVIPCSTVVRWWLAARRFLLG